jgi:diguanylate cyclase (GGDEF)-like protein
VLIIFSGYAFGAVHMFGVSLGNRTSPHTLLSLILLTGIACARRAEYGIFSIMLGVGMGGRIARIATPFALALPFALQGGSFALARSGALTLQYATATMTSVAAMLAFGLVILLARRIEEQEREVRDLSLRDGLTGLYNQKGFHILAEQALRLSQRAGEPFAVLFLDLDDLKPVNDSFGHDAGSRFLSEVADLLKLTFRKTDILGRIGGDEFVIAGEGSEIEMSIAATRLEEAAMHLSAQPGRLFPIRFSLGLAALEAGHQSSLENLMKLADNTMYEAKQRKKASASSNPGLRS